MLTAVRGVDKVTARLEEGIHNLKRGLLGYLAVAVLVANAKGHSSQAERGDTHSRRGREQAVPTEESLGGSCHGSWVEGF